MQTIAFLPAIGRTFSITRLGQNRLVIVVTALGVFAAAAAWQWNWLIAVGIAPLLLSVAPCAAMCGLGLCMHRMGGRGCSPAPQNASATQETLEIPSAKQEI